mmetsp:Transcript_31008/g.50164  ORF Transcript_31008/g.50164 Transcript_31008/m.50164 type:complete len:86 (-) Transcript_31008:745-1002(-)
MYRSANVGIRPPPPESASFTSMSLASIKDFKPLFITNNNPTHQTIGQAFLASSPTPGNCMMYFAPDSFTRNNKTNCAKGKNIDSN